MTGQLQDDTIERLLRELTPLALGAVVRRFHDFAAAEDAVQEASLDAALQWPCAGLPDNPRAWLTQVAFRRMTASGFSRSPARLLYHQNSDILVTWTGKSKNAYYHPYPSRDCESVAPSCQSA